MQVRALEASSGSTHSVARPARSASAGTTPRSVMLEPPTPRSAAHAQDAAHRRWLEDLRAQYGHPAISGALQLMHSHMYLTCVSHAARTCSSRRAPRVTQLLLL